MLKYKLTFYSVRMFIETSYTWYITSSPSPLLGPLASLQETIHCSVKNWASLCQHLHWGDRLSSLQMDSLWVLLIHGFRTKPEEIHSLDVYPILVKQPWDVALIYLISINKIGGPGREINIYHLQEIFMGFVWLDLVPERTTNTLHHQPFYRSLL